MKILREPLLQFLLIGIVLVTVHRLVQSGQKEEIIITTEAVEAAALAAGSSSDRQVIARDLLAGEILYREGLKQGFGEGPLVRDVVVRQFRKELEPVLPEPSDAELNQFRDQLPDQYHFPKKVSFEHVSFREDAAVQPTDLLERLRAGENHDGFGESIRLANPMPPTFQPQLERVLGKDASDAVFAMEPGKWNGPIRSQRGVHFIRVTSQEGGKPIELEQIRPTLAAIWLKEKTDEAIAQKVDEMAEEYRVVLPQVEK